MHLVIAVLAIAAAIVFFLVRMQHAYRAARTLNRDSKPFRHKIGNSLRALTGTRLSRIRDPQLSAAILAVQLIRSEAPVTAQEKQVILAHLENPLGVANPQALFEQAWHLTESGAFFSIVADQLAPLLDDLLDAKERSQLISMLEAVANAHGNMSDLQKSSVSRLKKRLSV